MEHYRIRCQQHCLLWGKIKLFLYWKKHSSEFNIILVDNNDKILISQGIEERFSSENEYQVVKK